MATTATSPKRRESVIGICLLAILVLIAAGIGLKQFNADMSRFGITAANEPKSQIIFTPAGFAIFSATQSYGPDNLYEKINGKAPLYLEAGFRTDKLIQ